MNFAIVFPPKMVQNIIIYYGLLSLSPQKGQNPKKGSKTLKTRKG